MDMVGGLARRITALETAKRSNASVVDAAKSYQFVVAPTCPPSTAVSVRAGIACGNTLWPIMYASGQIPANIADFTNATDTQLAANFTNANWYLGIILAYTATYLRYRTTPAFVCSGSTVEYQTATETEAAIDFMLNGNDATIFDNRFPLWAIILRNDGRTGVAGAVRAIGAVNRGASYLYLDARPTHMGQV